MARAMMAAPTSSALSAADRAVVSSWSARRALQVGGLVPPGDVEVSSADELLGRRAAREAGPGRSGLMAAAIVAAAHSSRTGDERGRCPTRTRLHLHDENICSIISLCLGSITSRLTAAR